VEGASGPSAFEAFYARAWRDAVRWASALTGSVVAGEDIAQEAFARLAGRFDSLDNPDGYLRVTIVNLARDDRRASHRRQARELRLVVGEATDDQPIRSGVMDAVARLPYEQRAALVLRYWADWDEATIATALGCRRSTVRSHAKRALDALRASTATWEDER
jgi:RNA polymerase sigma factor (sigma-70 family)